MYYLDLCEYTFAQRRNRITTNFSESIPVVKRRISVIMDGSTADQDTLLKIIISLDNYGYAIINL